MKIVVQRVSKASVKVDNNVIGKINQGFVVLLGIKNNDTIKDADYLVKKLVNLRIFKDDEDKMNLSLFDVKGELLIISQFTLYADCKKGNRPSFIKASSADHANQLYDYIIDFCKKEIPVVGTGIFGADMKVSLVNDGPFTIVLDSAQL